MANKTESAPVATETVATKSTKKVTTTYEKGSPAKVTQNVTFDFTGVSQSDILALAVSSVAIAYQNRIRSRHETARDFANNERPGDVEILVSDIIAPRVRTADPVAKAVRAVANMTPEQKAEMIAALQASL